MTKIAEIFPLLHPVQTRVSVPGSKSITNRAMLMAALADGVTTLHGASDAGDCLIMADLLHKLGIKTEKRKDSIVITGNGGKFDKFRGELNAGDAGTVMRFLCALCCIVPGETVLKGSARMHERPIHGLVDALRQLGAEITYLGKAGFPPVRIKGGSAKGGKVLIDASMSSQFVSALLMIAPLLEGDTEIVCRNRIASQTYIAMTVKVMKQFGMNIGHIEHGVYKIAGQRNYKPLQYEVEGDASSASYLFAIAALTGSKVEVTNLSTESLQGDAAFAGLLEKMGCRISKGKTIEATGSSSLKAVTADLSGMPDVAQTLAVLAAFAEGNSLINGLQTLQHKETRRITALKTELEKMGVACKADDNSLLIKGGMPAGARVQTYGDHRMAMAFAVAGTKIPGVRIEEPDVVKKSFPGFWNVLGELGIKIEIK